MRRQTEGQVVEKRAGGVPVRHDRLTALEQLLLRALYDYAEDEILNGQVADVMSLTGADGADAELLVQLLEEERADRQ